MPVSIDGTNTRAGLIAQADPAEGGHNARVADFLGTGLKELIETSKSISGVPKSASIAEHLDLSMSARVSIVLVNE